MRFLCFIIFNLVYFNSISLFSQTLKGNIINAVNLNPIEGVLLISFNDKNEIIEYKNSDLDGRFSIVIKNISKIEFRKIGYEVFILSDFKNLNFEIKLISKSEVILLDEVILKSTQYIRSSNDTIRYKAEDLRTEQDVNLEDLISKIPGIVINSMTGEIKYQNKGISKILIDGGDLTGKNYQLISKSLDQRIAKEIEIIEGYSDSKILKKFSRSQQTVINIKSEKKYRNKLKGNINLGYGIKDRYDEQSNIFLLGKIKALSHISYNNIGNFSLGSIASNSNFNSSLKVTENSVFKPIKINALTGTFSKLRVGNYIDLTQNRDFTVSENILFSKKDVFTSKFNLIYYNDLLSKESERKTFDLTKSEKNAVFTTFQTEEKKSENLSFSTSNKFIINRNLELNVDLSLKNKDTDFNKNGIINSGSFFEASNVNKKQSEISTRLVKKINYKNVIIAYSNFSFEKLKEIFRYNINIEQFNYVFNMNLKPNQLVKNNLNFENIFSENQIQYFYKPNPKNILSSSIGFSNIKINNNNNFALYDITGQVSNQLANKDKFSMQNVTADVNWSYFSNTLKFSSSFKLNNLNYNSKDKKWIPTISILADKRIGFNKITLSYVKSIRFPMFYYYFDNILQRNTTNYFQSNTSINLYNLSNSFTVKYVYNNIKGDYMTGLEGNYSITDNSFLSNISYENNATINSLVNIDNENSRLDISLFFDKFIPKINHSIKITPKFSQSNYINSVESKIYDSSNKNYKLKLRTGSAFDFLLNYNLGFEINRNNYTTENSFKKNTSRFTVYNGFLNLNANFLNKKLIVTNKNVWVRQDEFSPNIYISNIVARYKSNNLEFKCSLNNIFNTEAIFKRYQNNTTSTENKNSIINRNLIFQINFIF